MIHCARLERIDFFTLVHGFRLHIGQPGETDPPHRLRRPDLRIRRRCQGQTLSFLLRSHQMCQPHCVDHRMSHAPSKRPRQVPPTVSATVAYLSSSNFDGSQTNFILNLADLFFRSASRNAPTRLYGSLPHARSRTKWRNWFAKRTSRRMPRMPINLYQVASALSGISPARQVFTSWTIVWDQEKKSLLLSSCWGLESLRDVTFCRVAGSLCSFL